jgi:hypothetical protein
VANACNLEETAGNLVCSEYCSACELVSEINTCQTCMTGYVLAENACILIVSEASVAAVAAVAAASQVAVVGVMVVGMVGSMGGKSSSGSMFSLANTIQLIMILFCLRIAIDEGVVAYMGGMSFSAMDFSFVDDYDISLPGWNHMNTLAIPETQEL